MSGRLFCCRPYFPRGGGIYCFNDFYLPLWQNVLIRRLLLHPAGNRFHSGELQKASKNSRPAPGASLDNGWLGIIGFAAKR